MPKEFEDSPRILDEIW